jgi:hypothetical protein
MKYDCDEWHSSGDYPADLPPESAGTHIGMFLAWAIINGLAGEQHRQHSKRELDTVQARQMTGREFLRLCCDGSIADCDLNEEGNAFARHYYGEYGKSMGEYFYDYAWVAGVARPSFYHVEDTWENYDLIAEVIDEVHAQWREKRRTSE